MVLLVWINMLLHIKTRKFWKNKSLYIYKRSNEDGSIGTWKDDDKRTKKYLLNVFVLGELSFKFVDNEAFVEYTNALNQNVVSPSRTTISKTVFVYFFEEITKFIKIIGNTLNIMHLSTNTWTNSCQSMSYMVVTTLLMMTKG